MFWSVSPGSIIAPLPAPLSGGARSKWTGECRSSNRAHGGRIAPPVVDLNRNVKIDDADERCRGWSNTGECEKNPGFDVSQVSVVVSSHRMRALSASGATRFISSHLYQSGWPRGRLSDRARAASMDGARASTSTAGGRDRAIDHDLQEQSTCLFRGGRLRDGRRRATWAASRCVPCRCLNLTRRPPHFGLPMSTTCAARAVSPRLDSSACLFPA